MDIPTQKELIDRIEQFCLRHDIAHTRFGRGAVNNPAFLRQLRDGKSPTLETLNKLSDFMERTDAEAATRAKLAAEPEPSPAAEEEALPLPFSPAPVNPTGASSPTCSSTSEPPMPCAASGSCPSSSGAE